MTANTVLDYVAALDRVFVVEDLAAWSLSLRSMSRLRSQAKAMEGHVQGYRDGTNLEADAIIETRDGRWGAFEMKLGQKSIDEGAESLLRLLPDRVDPARHGPPAVLAVITGWGFGYRREDGVAVIPVGSLAP